MLSRDDAIGVGGLDHPRLGYQDAPDGFIQLGRIQLGLIQLGFIENRGARAGR